MTDTEVFRLLEGAAPDLLHLTLLSITAVIILIPLELIFPARHQPIVHRRGFRIDLIYWFFTPVLTRMVTLAIMAGVFVALFTLLGWPIDRTILDGYGPLARQPLWLQTIEILLIVDFMDYWTHRGFHVSRAWRFHAIHHSPEEMTWLASGRMHPLNDAVTRMCQVMPVVFLGLSVRGALYVVPFLALYVVLLHSNLRWDFGPFRYVFVSPAYHRWHHTSEPQGIDKNFSSIFPIWDLLFGTCYFPPREPTRFGVHRDPVPESLLGQLLYPFRTPSDELTHPELEPCPATGTPVPIPHAPAPEHPTVSETVGHQHPPG